ncbi:2'-5' RNA ligase family protein [Acidiplasma sp.]|uniref:2'-5' RNA ligase family protein n=1 Tax=Acidiplasma sp. TaxID=1872114 RepID=UPI002582B806|nr:2'-5' RNA ligase family protein [Acidiplasma sp.]
MYYTLIVKPGLKTRRRVTSLKKRISNEYGYIGTLSNKGVHITLAYLKDYRHLDMDKVYNVCKNIKAFNIGFDGLDYFQREKNGRIFYIVYLKVIYSYEFRRLHDLINNALKDNVINSSEFVPHLSIARKNIHDDELNKILQKYKNFKLDYEEKIDHILIGRRSSMEKRWNFKRVYFNDKF